MANFKYSVNGTVITRTWADGEVETFDISNCPENVLQYLAILGAKERWGTGGILANHSQMSFEDQRKIAAAERDRLYKGEVPSGKGSAWIPPTQEQLQAALALMFQLDMTDEALVERVKQAHPDATKKEAEKEKRRKQLKKDILASEDFRKSLKAQGYTPPEPKTTVSSLLAPLDA